LDLSFWDNGAGWTLSTMHSTFSMPDKISTGGSLSPSPRREINEANLIKKVPTEGGYWMKKKSGVTNQLE